MKKTRNYIFVSLAVLMILLSLVLYRTVELGRGDAKPAFLENLNPAGEMLGPEGIQSDSQGNLFVGDAQGIIWIFGSGGKPRIYAQLDQVRQIPGTGSLEGPIHSGGIAIDPAGNLFVAAYGFAGGSILRIEAGTQRVSLFARDLGTANYVLTTRDGSHLWVSDYRSHGRLLRYPTGGSPPVQPDLIIAGLQSPNGLALGKGEKTLFAAETYSGNVVRVDLEGAPPTVSRIANLKGSLAVGSLDGLAFDPRDRDCRFLYAAENLRGMFTVLDLQMNPPRVAKRISLATMGGRPCPASMIIRDGNLYFTDLWSCSPLRILLGFPRYRQHAYRFRVTDLTSIYQ